MAVYVLVGGAWMGGWVWKPVAARLRARGHDVYPATLTGLGERAHLARPDIDLETHLLDVVNLIRYEDLERVILVGHSYAGIVVTGVADRVPERLAVLVYCDSAPLGDGMSMLDMQSPQGQVALRREAEELGDGWRLPFPGFDELAKGASLTGLGDAERALMERHAVAQPFGTYTQVLRLTHAGPPPYRRAAILCQDGQRLKQMLQARRSSAGRGGGDQGFQPFGGDDWAFLELDTGHWPMLSEPDALARLLDGLG